MPVQLATRRTDDDGSERLTRWQGNATSNPDLGGGHQTPDQRPPHLQTIEHHFSRMEASGRPRRPLGPYSNLESYTNKTNKESSLPNVRSRSTLNDPNQDKYQTIGRKKMENLMNKTRDRPSKHQSLPVVNHTNKNKFNNTHQNIKVKSTKNGRKSEMRLKSRKQTNLSPRPRMPRKYEISAELSPQNSPQNL